MSYLESEALCPYYKSDDSKVIRCEGAKIKIKDKKMKTEIGYGYCADRYNECTIKIALDNYYERKK